LETVGFEDRAASPDELKMMQEMIADGMQQGAFGFSTGLDYSPCRFSDTEELTAICETVSELGGLSVWHTRGRDLGLMDAIKEVLSIGEATGVNVHFSHFAANGPQNIGKSKEMLKLIDDARDRGLSVSFDAYSYDASSTTLLITLPRWVHDGGPEAIIERFRDPEQKKKMCDEMLEKGSGWEKMVLACAPSPKHRDYIGKSLPEGAAACGKNVAEFICDLLLEENLNAGYVSFTGSESDIQSILQHPCHTGCSDGILVGEQPNPRGWGTFPRFISKYWRDLKLLSLEEMIRRLTGAPAQCMGLSDRGLIKSGLAADVIVFDPNTIQDTAAFENPKQHPQGIEYVLVNGQIVVDKGEHTGVLNGRALKMAS
jgi:N-acyl-D-amino-acid deacylase